MLVKSLVMTNGCSPLVEDGVQAMYGLDFWGLYMQDLHLIVTADLMNAPECWRNGQWPGRLLRCTFWDRKGQDQFLVQDLEGDNEVLLLLRYDNGSKLPLEQTEGPSALGWGLVNRGSLTAHGRVFRLKPGERVVLVATRSGGRDKTRREQLTVLVGPDGSIQADKMLL